MATQTLSNPYPVKLDWATKEVIEALKKRTKLSASEILRRAVRFSAPKFLSGEVSILDFTDEMPSMKGSKRK